MSVLTGLWYYFFTWTPYSSIYDSLRAFSPKISWFKSIVMLDWVIISDVIVLTEAFKYLSFRLISTRTNFYCKFWNG